jgi:formylglycine-generating enzyme required for sulfatase activity
VLRGGSWIYGPEGVRAFYRVMDVAVYRISYIGFRLAQDID